MHLSGVRLSVPFGCSTPPLRVCCCGPGSQEILIDCCTAAVVSSSRAAARRAAANADSATLSADVGSLTQTCFIINREFFAAVFILSCPLLSQSHGGRGHADMRASSFVADKRTVVPSCVSTE